METIINYQTKDLQSIYQFLKAVLLLHSLAIIHIE